MTIVLARPHGPLVFRSGRGFAPGVSGQDAIGFPPPGTVAGALRAAYADAVGWTFSGNQSHAALRKQVSIAGPFLAGQHLRESAPKPAPGIYFPRPADAVYVDDSDGKAQPVRLMPQPVPADADCDLPGGLSPLVLQTNSRAKPAEGPAFWSLQDMAAWLARPESSPADVVAQLPYDDRTHVGIDDDTGASQEGRLFRTRGLDFSPRALDDRRAYEERTWLLAARIEAPEPMKLSGEMRRFGGEGRTVTLKTEDRDLFARPDFLTTALAALAPGAIVRIVLATPAIFRDGWCPANLDSRCRELCGKPMRLRLVAAAVERWQPYSGWDLEANAARSVRRMAPAGSVFWYELLEGSGSDLASLWMQAISDQEQDRRDGFGIALPGVGWWGRVQFGEQP